MTQLSPRSRRIPRGWIPSHHGAWAMITIPPILGVNIGGPSLAYIPLIATWLVGYLLFQATMLWLKSRRKPRYFPPVRTYGIIAVPLATSILVATPRLTLWSVVFLPLIAASTWLATHKWERSLLNDTIMVLAAALMVPVTFHVVAEPADPRWLWTGLVFGVVLFYFLGTVFHVKSLIRNANTPHMGNLSFGYHLCGAILLTPIALGHLTTGTFLEGKLLFVVLVGLAVRARVLLWVRKQAGPLSPVLIGVVEVVFAVLLAASLLRVS